MLSLSRPVVRAVRKAWKRPGAEWSGELIHRCLEALPELGQARDNLAGMRARPNSVDDLMTVQMDLASRRADQWVLPPDDVVLAGCFVCF